ncbi:MAG TPA: error-prone DNA polymerase [Jatrophihabitans sp.]|jgi:error-prone DNA polymerase|uniref:error-prone DNA polymerase n=1 Tax=Jatrophihabitans sp. TaxID=1932789 RepID=UPI002F1F087A
MGFNNPVVPWHELERRLSGRPEPRASQDGGPEPSQDGGSDGGPGASQEPAPASAPATPVESQRRGHGDDREPDGGDSPAWSRKRPAYEAPAIPLAGSDPVPYAELHAHSSFSFLDGSCDPEQLVEEAVALGLQALALTDHDGMYGVARFAEAADAHGLPTVFGAELNTGIELPRTRTERSVAARSNIPDPPGTHLLVLARNPSGYASLCRAISQANLRGGAKGRPVYDLNELTELSNDNWLILTGCRKGSVRQALEGSGAPEGLEYGTFALDPARRALAELVDRFGRDNVAVELTHALEPLADERYAALAELAGEQRLPLVASTAAHYAAPANRPLATAMAAVRARTSLDALDGWLPGWAGQHLRSGAEVAARFRRYPQAVATAARLGAELAFPLRLVAPKLPPFPVPDGVADEMGYLRQLTYDGARTRYGPPSPATDRAYRQLEHELAVIDELGFAGYFLVVWELTQFCAERQILCQGRGSAANSAVCFALGITAVDSVGHNLLFERFLAPDRDGPPDIDIDIESDRREEVIQHVYSRHGRQHAAQVANVITYRPRSAVRDIARALGYAPGQQDAWSKQMERGYHPGAQPEQPEQPARPGQPAGTERPADRAGEAVPEQVLALAAQLQNAPRHLGIHSGGMVICDRPVIEVCPVEWGRMPGRTVLQWDKDDCAATGLVKFDLLGLGMLSALKYCFEFVESHHGHKYGLHEIPPEDPRVYDMLCAADTVGVFQVESRAQMATLPRLKPRTFYDLVIEIALIRPGPIQGDSVHPYLRRRNGLEPISYPHPRLQPALERTLGIPLFQEQLMRLAIDGAGCTPAEADQVRRAMGSKRSEEKMARLRDRLYEGMRANGITGEVADEIYQKMKAFAAFGFAESHSISFAFLVYASSWLKLYYPAAFCAALLNAQPMGFYSPQSLVHDAKRHGVAVRGPDINASLAPACLQDAEPGESGYAGPGPGQPAVRLGLSSVRAISDELAGRIVAEREHGGYTSITELSRRVGLNTTQLEALATAGAFESLGISRRQALWAAGAAADYRPGQLELTSPSEQRIPRLPPMTEPEQLMADLWATGITRDRYPTAVIRDRLDSLGVIASNQLRRSPDRTRVVVGGIVTHRQRPATARGVIFLNLEDEFGMINVVCDPVVWQRHHKVAVSSGGLLIRGMLQRADGVLNVLAERIEPLHLGMRTTSRDFR